MSHSEDVSIRRFREPDLCQLVRLISEKRDHWDQLRRSLPAEGGAILQGLPFRKENCRPRQDWTTLVVEEDGELVATGSLVDGEILPVFVHPRLQKGGRGKALMKALENEARANGVAEIGLSISLPSRRFYETLGCKIVEEKSRDVGEGQRLDFWKAVKQLPKS